MSVTSTFSAVFFIGLATYAMRGGLILALADAELPPWLLRALRYVAPAVLGALTVTLVANPDEMNNGVTLAEVVGLLVAGPVAWKTKNLALTLLVGMVAFWLALVVT